MENPITERRKRLTRSSKLDAMEATCLGIAVGESKEFKIDASTYNSITTRLARLRKRDGLVFSTVLNENIITVTRNADERNS